MGKTNVVLSISLVAALGGLLAGHYFAHAVDVRTYTATGQFLSASALPQASQYLIAGLTTLFGAGLGLPIALALVKRKQA